jgi:DNA polymerase elongation subunit (family B)
MKAKVLLVDIETAPIEGFVWGLWDNNLSLNQIKTDWNMLSWAAKWLHKSEVMYDDASRTPRNDKKISKSLAALVQEADVIITHNGISFDRKKWNARFVKHGMKPPKDFKHIDTLRIAKKHFDFTSNKLEYLAEFLGAKVKKFQHKDFPGFELWVECLKGNKKAWKEMKKYNKQDVLALEQVYKRLIPWDSSLDFSIYEDHCNLVCSCGSTSFHEDGYRYTNKGKYKRFECKKCGKQYQGSVNLFTKQQKKVLKHRK